MRPWEVRLPPGSLKAGAKELNAARAALLVHGAGCTNLIFMRERAVFCEVQPSWPFFCHWEMSRAFALHFVHVRIPAMRLSHNLKPSDFTKLQRPALANAFSLLLAEEDEFFEQVPADK